MANQAHIETFDFDADDYENMENDFAPVNKRGQKHGAAVPTVTFHGDADDYENMESDVAPPVPVRAKKGKKDETAKPGDLLPQPEKRAVGTAVHTRLKSRWWLMLLLLILLFFMFLVLATLTGLLFIQYSSISDELRNLKYLDSEKIEQNKMKQDIKDLQGKLDSEKREQNKMKQDIMNLQEKLGTCCGTCPPGWHQIANSCYYLSNEKSTWEESKNACKLLKALLLIIKDRKETESLNRIFPKNPRYWIGLKRDTQSSDTWKWLDDTPMTFSNWASGEPNNSGNQENCVESIAGPWNDRDCEESQQYICKSTLSS